MAVDVNQRYDAVNAENGSRVGEYWNKKPKEEKVDHVTKVFMISGYITGAWAGSALG